MNCLIRNISAGLLSLPEFTLKRNEELTINFTERIRYYIAMGYIRMIDFVPDEAVGYTFYDKVKKEVKEKKESKVKKEIKF
jgi:hypothetical protein